MLKLKKAEDLLLFLTLLFLPTQLGKHFWPQFSYVYSLKVDYLSPVVYFWDLLVVMLFAVWIFKKPKINKRALNLLLLFLGASALSLLNAQNPGAGLVRLEQYTVAGLFGFYLASSSYKTLRIKIFLPLFIGIVFESAIAAMQVIKGATLGFWILGERNFTISTPAIAKFDFYGKEILRPYATFGHPNVLAGYILITGILIKERLKIFGVILIMLTLFLTMSRVALLSGIASAALLFTKKWRVIIFLLILILSPFLYARFSSLLNFDNLTLLRREELLRAAWDLFLQNPFSGAGLNNFIPAVANNLITGPSRFLQPVHNIFLLVLSETGLFGLAAFIALIAYPAAKGKFLLPFIIIIFLGLFDHYFLTLPQGYRLLFLVWGLSFSVLK